MGFAHQGRTAAETWRLASLSPMWLIREEDHIMHGTSRSRRPKGYSVLSFACPKCAGTEHAHRISVGLGARGAARHCGQAPSGDGGQQRRTGCFRPSVRDGLRGRGTWICPVTAERFSPSAAASCPYGGSRGLRRYWQASHPSSASVTPCVDCADTALRSRFSTVDFSVLVALSVRR